MPGSNDSNIPNTHYVTPFFEFRTGVAPDDAEYSSEPRWLRLESNVHAYDNQVWLILKESVTTGETVTIKLFARMSVNGTDGMYLIKEIADVSADVMQFIPNVPACPIYVRLTNASDANSRWAIHAAHTLSGSGRTLYALGGNNEALSV